MVIALVTRRRIAARSIKRKAFIVKSVLNSELLSSYLCGMRSMPILFTIIVFNLNCRAQDLAGYSISLSTAINRMDLYSGVRLGKQTHRIETGFSLESGINRTIFQTRFFPRITFDGSYFFLQRETVQLGPVLSYSYSLLQINKESGSFHHWNECYGGYSLSIGKTLRFRHTLTAGWMNERFRSQISQEKEGVSTLGFYSSIGLSYAW